MLSSVDIVERFLASGSENNDVANELVSWLKTDLRTGNTRNLVEIFPSLLIPELDYTVAISLYRILKQMKTARRELVVAAATDRGLTRVLGEYIPTPKNALVRDHYRSLGFAEIDGEVPGHTYWELRIDDDSKPHEHFIRENPADERTAV